MRRALTAIALTVAVTGCSAPEEAPPEAPWVDVGHGLRAYSALDDGDSVEMVFGPQGGWHLDLASHIGGTSPEDHFAIYRVWDLQRTAQIAYPIKALVTLDNVIPHDAGCFAQVGMRTVFAIKSADEVRDKEWLLEVELIAGKDVFVDERVVVVVDDMP